MAEKEIKDRGWNYSELARRGGASHARISQVLSGGERPGADFCFAIGRALGVSPEAVLRRAGLLPPLLPAVEEEQEAIAILRSLPADVRAVVMMMRGLKK